MERRWIAYIPAISLDRGCDYFESGAVHKVEARSDGWRAKVAGYEFYSVFVPKSFDPREAQCTCPHFADGNICKHIAAAMLAIEAWENEKRDTTVGNSEQIEDILARIEPDALREFVLGMASRDPALERELRATFGFADVAQAERDLQKTTASLMHSYERGGFIDWHDAMDFEFAYREAVESIVRPFVSARDVNGLISLAVARLVQLQRICIDDSDGFFRDALADVQEHLDLAFEWADPGQRQELLEMLVAFIEENPGRDRGDVYWFEQEVLEEYLVDCFAPDSLFAGQVIAFADERLAGMPEQLGDSERDAYRHDRRQWSVARVRAMHALGESPVELHAYSEANVLLDVSDVLHVLADSYVEVGQARDAVELLRAHLDARAMFRSVRAGESSEKIADRLVSIARDALDDGELAELYRSLLLDKPAREVTSSNLIDWYDGLRGLVDAGTWDEERAKLLERMPNDTVHACLAHEGALDELYERIVADGGNGLMAYERLLSPKYPKPYIEYYLKSARFHMDRASDRHAYRRVAEELAHAAELTGGQDLAEALAAEFRREYPRRPALRDELRNAGF